MESLFSWEIALAAIAQYGMQVIYALIIFFVGKWLVRRLVELVRPFLSNYGLDKTVSGFVSNIAYIVLLVLVVIATLTQLGVPTASFIAMIGAAGLAIGLALQGSLSNFASGVLLVAFHPCKVGDYIEAGGASGTVTKISVFSTTLITPDQRTITIPNTGVLSGPIINYSTSPYRRLDLIIGVSYKSDVKRVIALLKDVVEADSRVLSHEPVQIGLLELADSSLKFAVRPWVSNSDYGALRYDLLEKIKQALDTAGIDIPYPQIDIHLDKKY